MEKIIEELYRKRFNITRGSKEACDYNIGTINHVACMIKGSIKRGRILSIGINKYNARDESIHAEHDMINRLRRLRSGEKETVSIVVLRLTKHGKLSMSRPCEKCEEKLRCMLCKGYIVKKVYYSNAEGSIVREKV